MTTSGSGQLTTGAFAPAVSNQIVGAYITKRREEIGMSIETLSLDTGINEATLQQIENDTFGYVSPLTKGQKIADALRVPIQYFYTGYFPEETTDTVEKPHPKP